MLTYPRTWINRGRGLFTTRSTRDSPGIRRDKILARRNPYASRPDVATGAVAHDHVKRGVNFHKGYKAGQQTTDDGIQISSTDQKETS
jgi:hypothetical protein